MSDIIFIHYPIHYFLILGKKQLYCIKYGYHHALMFSIDYTHKDVYCLHVLSIRLHIN